MGKFKKGDFVRVKPGRGTVLLKDEGIYEVLGLSDQGDPILPVTTSNGIRINLDYSAECLNLWRRAAEQPAPFKIEAGRFYKTRDGRKVGPMAAWPDEEDCFKSSNLLRGGLWKTDGSSYFKGASDSPALIAEWIDGPAAKASTGAPSNDNAKPKFKVGDRVRVVKQGFTNGGSGHNAKVGDVFTLKCMNSAKTFWRTDGPDFYEHELEPVLDTAKVTPTISIVALIENGQPKPSSTPHVHASTGAAEKEAKRLAAKYKGKQFGVFTLTTTHEEAAPVYDHKWQNMAALGLKIDAIKELRAVAGLTLKGAKDAVEAWIEYEQAA